MTKSSKQSQQDMEVMREKSQQLSERERMAFVLKAAQDKLINFCEVINPKWETVWFHELIAEKLQEAVEKVQNKKKARIILTVAPRHGKSQLSSIYFPAWALGKYPDLKFIFATYGAELAERMGLQTRDVISSEMYQMIFPHIELRQDQKAKAKWMTNKKGSYTAVGAGGPITGAGGDVVIIDDLLKSRDEAESETMRNFSWDYYRSTLYSRLEGYGAVIVIMQRWHCLSAEQYVNIEGKMIKIKDVKKGDLILTPKGFQPIKHVQKNKLGDKKMLRLRFAGSGNTIEVTDDHLIKTTEGWKKAIDFKVGDNAVLDCAVDKNEIHEKQLKRKSNKSRGSFTGERTTIQKEKLIEYLSQGKTTTEIAKLLGYKSRNTVSQHLSILGMSADFKNSLNDGYASDKDFWWTLGRWMADGARSAGRKINEKNRISICFGKKKAKDIEVITRFLNKHNIKHSKEEKESVFDVRFSCKQFADYTRDIGGNAHNKKIPPYIFELPKHLKESFIEGYASGDAYKKENITRYSSVSYDLVSGLQNLLLTLNRHSNIYYVKVNTENKKIKSCGYVYELKEFECDKTENNRRTKQLKSIEVVDDYNDYVYDVTVDAGEININGITVHNCDDLVGKLIEEEDRRRQAGEPTEDWEVINFPAIAEQDEFVEGSLVRKEGEALWPSKFPLEILNNIKATSGTYNFVSQYQQQPVNSETQEFKTEWFKYFDDDALIGKHLKYYTIIDPAISQKKEADNTVVLTVAKEVNGPNWYRVREDAGHFTPTQTINLIFQHQQQYRSWVYVETVAYQAALKFAIMEEQRSRQVYFVLNEIKTATNKEVRIRGLIPAYQAGVVWHKRSDTEYERELLTFPASRRDDRMDCMSMAIQVMQNTSSGNKQFRHKFSGYFNRT